MSEQIKRDLLPNALAIGVRLDEFWNLTMRDYRYIMEGHKVQRKMIDEYLWLNGIYTRIAVTVAVSNVMSGKNSKAKYIENPLLSDENKKDDLGIHDNMTEEEIREATAKLFRNLDIMQKNFNLSRDVKNGDGE